jgi:hypothetical protein
MAMAMLETGGAAIDRSTAGSAELPTGCVDLVINAQLSGRLDVQAHRP